MGGDWWEGLEPSGLDQREARESVPWNGATLHRGDRVRFRPRRERSDIFDLALYGRVATVDWIAEDDEAVVHLAVTVEDDPAAELGRYRQPGNRFYCLLLDVEPIS